LTTKQHKAVMDGLRTQLAGLLARDADHRPHPASWLNARRWEDIADAPTPPVPQRSKPLSPEEEQRIYEETLAALPPEEREWIEEHGRKFA
jgi:DNA-directed RNA polymerase specialized sigma24 family protein